MATDYTLDLDKHTSGDNTVTDLGSSPFLAPAATIAASSGSPEDIAAIKFTITGADADKIVLAENLGKFELTRIGNTDNWKMTYTGNGTPNWQHALRSVTVTDLNGIANNDTQIKVSLLDSSGERISNVAKDTLICFFEGTLIATPQGERKVQDLKIGDTITTADGAVTTVKWVGIQTVSRYFADPTRSFPIRIRAHAIAENVPCRDLLVSPDHALMIDGVLIHAGALLNGTSVMREESLPTTFHYYHVETPEHALILAENTPAETFIDNVDRASFDNWAEHEALYGNDEPTAEMPHARAKSARQVPVAIRAKLAERGAELVGESEAA